MFDYEREDRVIGAIPTDKARRNADRVYLNYRGERRFTYEEVNERACRVANALAELGVGKDDKVCVFTPNCPEFVFTLFALAKLGGVLVPLNSAYRGDILQYVINNSDAETLIVDEQLLDRLDFVKDQLTGLRRLIVRQAKPGALSLATSLPFETLTFEQLYTAPAEEPHTPVRYRDLIAILYTSGTTGRSKGVMLCHQFYYHYGRTFVQSFRYGPDDVLYSCLPLFHVNAQNTTILAALLAEGQAAIYDRFSVTTFWDEIRDSGATVFNGLGAMGNILMAQPESTRDRDHKLRIGFIVPAPEHLKEFERRFGLRVAYSTFGQTEVLPMRPLHPDESRPGSAGKLHPLFEARIVDDDDNELPDGQVGELILRPKEPFMMMSGYYKYPEATVEASRNLWHHTGDRLRRDSDGYYYFVDRKKESIRRRGENISAWEIEKVVNEHPLVVESAAVPVPSPLSEDDVKLCVILKPGAVLSPEDLIDFCVERMPYYMVPRYIEFKASFPKNPSEKTEKYKLKEEGVTRDTWDRESAGIKIHR